MFLHEKREAISLSVRQTTIISYKNAPLSTMNKVKFHLSPNSNIKLILYIWPRKTLSLEDYLLIILQKVRCPIMFESIESTFSY